ncbi:GNAT family N-acetyltransferase [Mycobacteroides abscessus]|uniref:GNAT family N-acetyltransferase n=1 Tax=Mycobacteroides abscessus TaxID=36809 RepID=UPI0009280D5D|nr:GNAT family N-acetyltransferase [Mycobacteroides abscessus]QST90617.1 hypothetical protein PROPHIGD52-1_34 [Mycobacterium phage prophi52-1]MBN7332405.1 GNAT family N-acetyltransferase [Mycobacteroides abscessus subsp. abscessus]SHX23391.1 GCN5-like N-acetyltransferase [Mycobacteroides abscessus subsp. abscessus]SHY14707.1 GCN5-like N-acetyltransferase [Mycobacteroides abscessus subsp. abscessus]SIA41797.1 GCN5-like N-acetyltransferase [Mycobacteroides abscessus subsp. abscessus]
MSEYSRPRAITERDDISGFESGAPSLDEYLHNRALANHVGDGSRCFVTCKDGRVMGYYSLSSTAVLRSDMPGRVRRNMPDPIPAILLARLAVDRKTQGMGLGGSLLRDAILRTVQVSEQVGVKILLVHALHEEARTFYERFDFEPSPTDPLHLFLLMKDARAILGNFSHA